MLRGPDHVRLQGKIGSGAQTAKVTRMTQLRLDKPPYISAPSVSEICIRPCEPVHIHRARLASFVLGIRIARAGQAPAHGKRLPQKSKTSGRAFPEVSEVYHKVVLRLLRD